MPLSPSQTRVLLEQLGHRPKKQLGQNFLIDGNIVRKSLELAEVKEGDHVVEIGPGLGTLTQALLDAGAIVHAVEKDPVLGSHVEAIANNESRLHLIKGDALVHPLGDLPADVSDYKIVANLPYAISTPWMATVLEDRLPCVMTLMLQKEAAQRYAAKAGTKQFGAISIFLHAAFDVLPGHDVSGSCFYPKPDVGSTLLHLRRKAAPFRFRPQSTQLIREIFQQRRKQISSLLRKSNSDTASHWLESLQSIGIDPSARPEQIDAEKWISLEKLIC
ncbi:16S rRNA (adenine(1518)-N(6)/adenine(1519)-N(6))-dimethyltransferase RsmA [Pelagicoccus sp. SDUM812002]|uniref:16S rRNA (adenine(1518)-N(6)/adenine(1519)-N(6))- dimethyltransferase RsmA n=1 Tax=Pelagicoccus sp. SDUM812002 TaxID=3041266 RepID=UPI00280D2FFC|nr:16S rRNA (adenine(1518)-N(6)/adenine(1519)-N(6))-dimethyltransferase RsmA [Pelagicoccus sp. SDUM812002]MDQ8185506.1 16S rRNA (adenine(1518)-N(6)/adenine(1519)-N(6))-dimethyltransferase RsmA [Pelagicoccus sp. SDUM812002]